MPTGRTGRILALGLLLLALGIAYLLIIAPVIDMYNERQAVLADRQMLAPRLSAAASELPALRARLAELQAAAQTRKITLDGASDSIAAANLQSRVEELATAAGVSIGSTEGLAAENSGGYRRIGLRVAISGEFDGFIKLLGAIESSLPPLVLSSLQIHSSSRLAATARSRRAAHTESGEQTGLDQPDLRVDAGFEVYGFRNIESPVALRQ